MDVGVQRRNFEAHQHFAATDAIAFALRDLGDARGFGSDDDQLRAWRGIHVTGGVNDGANAFRARAGAVVTGIDGFGVDLLGRRLAAAGCGHCT